MMRLINVGVPLLCTLAVFSLPPQSGRCDGEPLSRTTLLGHYASPSFLTYVPGDESRMYLTELYNGRVRVFVDGTLVPLPFLELPSYYPADLQLRGLALHPDFASNRMFFVFYMVEGIGARVSRFTASSFNPDTADAATEEILIEFETAGDHSGGWIGFGPHDGYLYVSTGDYNMPCAAQDLSSYLGKILRIDVNSPTGYAVPADNPFVDGTGLPEVWAYGLRNPWRCSFERATGNLIIADMSHNTAEELNLLPHDHPGGANFGWPAGTGAACFSSACGDYICDDPNLILPFHQYLWNVNDKRGIIGGEFYYGCREDMHGKYFFGDITTGDVWSMRITDGAVSEFRSHGDELNMPSSGIYMFRIITFGADARGDIYIGNLNAMYKIDMGLPEITDCNRNCTADEVDISSGAIPDCDANLVPDDCQADCNLNLVADICDVTDRTSIDCNENLIPDECDSDIDDDGMIDDCDNDADGDGFANDIDACPLHHPLLPVLPGGRPRPDVTGDCLVNGDDHVRRVMCTYGSGPMVPAVTPFCTERFDLDDDRDLDLQDYAILFNGY